MLSSNSHAWDQFGDQLDNPKQEERAKALFKEIRCVVCSGESINDSNADLAQDMRRLIRQKIQDGETDETIIHFFVENYGNEILMEPTLNQSTYILWFAPFIFLLLGAFIVFNHYRISTKDTDNSSK